MVDKSILQNSDANKLWDDFSRLTDSKNYCVIHDAGKITGTEFTRRRAMSPAIIYDPATSKLNTFSSGINTNKPEIKENQNNIEPGTARPRTARSNNNVQPTTKRTKR